MAYDNDVPIISLPAVGNPAPWHPRRRAIKWRNDTGHEISSFTLPTCVGPPTSPAPIAAGGITRTCTVNAGTSGTFDYSYFVADALDTREGTIDVENL